MPGQIFQNWNSCENNYIISKYQTANNAKNYIWLKLYQTYPKINKLKHTAPKNMAMGKTTLCMLTGWPANVSQFWAGKRAFGLYSDFPLSFAYRPVSLDFRTNLLKIEKNGDCFGNTHPAPP